MKKKKQNKDILLGSLITQIVGIQYYDGVVRPGEEFHFEREPDNSHDASAIRVENLDFEQVGNLPRKLVAWLAPLIDAGKVRVNGKIPQEMISLSDKNQYSYPLLLSIYLFSKGKFYP